MNLSKRSKLSLCQFLTLFGRDDLSLLLSKYGFSTDELENQWAGASIAAALREVVIPASASQLEGLVQELARTRNSMRTGVSPRYNFDQRWTDLRLCLELDGYAKERDGYEIEQDRFVPIEPIIEGAEPLALCAPRGGLGKGVSGAHSGKHCSRQLNNVNPQAWLADVLDRIAGTPQSQLDELLPWNWQDSQRHDQAA